MSTVRCALLLVLALMLSACHDREAQAVGATFKAFQQAAIAGDRASVAALLTEESRPAAAQIDLGQVSGPAEVRAVDRVHSGRYELTLREQGKTEDSAFVLVREAGSWRIDLVETLLANHAVRPGEGFSLTPTELDQEQIERARAVEASGIR